MLDLGALLWQAGAMKWLIPCGVCLLLATSLVACDAEQAQPPVDAEADAAETASDADVVTSDTNVSVGDTSVSDTADATSADTSAPPPGLPTTCTGACSRQDLTATVTGETYAQPIAHGHFGLTVTSGEATTLHIEATEGDGGDCPTETSPTPAYLLAMSGVALPLSSATLTEADGLNATLIDFYGDLLPEGTILASAGQITLTPTAALLCDGCTDPISATDPGAFVAFDVDIEIDDDDGAPLLVLAGHVYASHCDSLDAIE